MHVFGYLGTVPSLIALLLGSTSHAQDTWCGKVYQEGSQEIIPGGWMTKPSQSASPLLDVKITPRHSIYVDSESTAEFIIDTGISYLHGSRYDAGTNGTSDSLCFTVEAEGKVLVSDTVKVNTTDNLFKFHLTGLGSRMEAYQVTLTGTTEGSNTNYTASTELFYLPDKATGSVVKVDNLFGSLLYRNNATGRVFKRFLPYGYYGNYSGYFNVSFANIVAYVTQGFNAVNPVSAFTDGDMTDNINAMDELNLLFQYDMRGSYKNLTSVAEQVPLVKDHPSLLTWYTADEPDGHGDPLNATKLSYDLLATMDKYHPTAIVLNCQNYYFEEYSSGADIIMEDAYPVGINATFSKWNTPCNITYGDCGCDNCEGTLLDVPSRIEDFGTYSEWIGGAATRKPLWAVPQAFSGEGYWMRDPTLEEVWVMDMLAFNHGAKGRLAWIYPPTDPVNGNAGSRLARIVTASPVVDFFTEANPVLIQDGTTNNGLDVAYWALNNQVLVGVVNPANASIVSMGIDLPSDITVLSITSKPWGNVSWTLDGSRLVADGGLPGLSTSFIILQYE